MPAPGSFLKIKFKTNDSQKINPAILYFTFCDTG